jgi:hypothetical protein
VGYCPDIESADCERNNLGDIVKHKHCEVIKAWADGAKIQIQAPSGEWFDLTESSPLWNGPSYRVRPETVRYRVSLHVSDEGDHFLMMAENSGQELHLSRYPTFKKWLGDWQEVEV